MHSFEVVILGASGGPDTGATQCFIVRPAGWHGLDSVCVDGGAGVTQIARMLAKGKDRRLVESFYANDYESVDRFLDKEANVVAGLPPSLCSALSSTGHTTGQRAYSAFQAIRGYYLTHAHLDHIAAMVLDSPLIFGAQPACAKTIWGLPFTTQAIQQHIFNDTVWPNLLQGCGGLLRLEPLRVGTATTCSAFERLEVTPFPVSHGRGASNRRKMVYSTVYLFRDRITGDCILICGDMEPDGDEPLLGRVWSHIAANVPLAKLKAIVIECSSQMGTSELYGHLDPETLVKELAHLQGLYGQQAQARMHIVLVHVKNVCSMRDPRLVILEEVRKQASRSGLHGVRFSVATCGYTFFL